MLKEKTIDTPFGFRTGNATVHTSRSMMLKDLIVLFSVVPPNACSQKYRDAIIEQNVLGLATQGNRVKTAGFLTQLYSLDPGKTIFRVLRQIWEHDVHGRPLLACLCACARDRFLFDSIPFVYHIAPGTEVVREDFEGYLEGAYPSFLTPKTRKSSAQNLGTSWTHSGHLQGRITKVRVQPVATPGTIAYSLLLGYLSGIRGGCFLPPCGLGFSISPHLMWKVSHARLPGLGLSI